jgi:hypothetical protein
MSGKFRLVQVRSCSSREVRLNQDVRLFLFTSGSFRLSHVKRGNIRADCHAGPVCD